MRQLLFQKGSVGFSCNLKSPEGFEFCRDVFGILIQSEQSLFGSAEVVAGEMSFLEDSPGMPGIPFVFVR